MATLQTTNGLRLAEDGWLGARLGKPAFHLTGDLRCLQLCAKSLSQRLALRPLFVDAKVAVEDVASVAIVWQLGFALIDTQLKFSLSKREAVRSFDSNISFASPDMDERIGSIAERYLTCDRFHRDPAIPHGAACRIKRDWARNFFAGLRGDWMVVAVRDSVPIGFLQLLRSPRDELIIDLIAVDENYRRQGLARSMIAFAVRHCNADGPMIVGTQAANVPSVQLYESMGFRYWQAQYVFHCHGANSG
jgi:ribosomal protein S18 acetylase RimI-like enzyme